jgi:hypothetical protein
MKGITQSSSDKYSQVEGIYKLLQFDNEAVLEIAHDIIDECFKQAKYDINVSRTGESEILIYTQMDGQYRNIIIDRDADIEYSGLLNSKIKKQ